MLDLPYLFEDFATFGAIERPWERNGRNPEAPIFGFFSEKDFDPDVWRGEYPNPAFQNLTEGDAAWATRIITRFTPEQIAAAVRAGRLSNPDHTAFLNRVLLNRQRTLETRYFAKLSPLSDVTLEGDRLCAVDLSRRKGTYAESSYRYRASIARAGEGRASLLPIAALEGGKVCMPLPSRMPDGGAPDDDRSRYVVVRVLNGASKGPLELHLYDRGPAKGYALAGIERPE